MVSKASLATRHRTCLLALLAAVVAASGCISMAVPERFLILDRSPSQLRATTPEESKIWVREFDDDTKASLAFWKDALKADFEKNRGYTLMGEASAKDGAGHEGFEMIWEATLGGRAVREMISVFVVPGLLCNTVRVVEYVADVETFAKEVETVRRSVSTVQ